MLSAWDADGHVMESEATFAEPYWDLLPAERRPFVVESDRTGTLSWVIDGRLFPVRTGPNQSAGNPLSKGGVPLRVAQEVMRHSNPTLTANVYTDPALLDVQSETNTQRATDTDGGAEKFAPNPDSTCISESIPDKIAESAQSEVNDVSAVDVKRSERLTTSDQWAVQDSNL